MTDALQVDDRKIVLDRIREALKSPRIHHPSHGHAVHASDAVSPVSAWLPVVPADYEAQVDLFAQQSGLLKTEFIRTEQSLLPDIFGRLRVAHGWNKWASHHTEWSSLAESTLGKRALSTDQPYDKRDLETCDVGISGCDALVAQTGSVLLGTRSAGGRALSILPPHHVVVAKRDQVVPDLPSAMRLIQNLYGQGENLPSMLCLTTGPSRTGDIERILVLGAHGPKKLTVILVG
ncbi:MAG: lactate utilization protein C [Candidatus Methylacidiphilales bacterium]